jgi:hypothetical protein
MYHSRAISMLAGLAAAFNFNKPYGGEKRRDVSRGRTLHWTKKQYAKIKRKRKISAKSRLRNLMQA